MSYGLSVLVSDIPANVEVGLAGECYFRCGDVRELAGKMESALRRERTDEEREAVRARVAVEYDWGRIARETVRVYQRARA